MLDNQTAAKLREMKLKVMAKMLSEPDDIYRDLSFEERLGIMVDKEWMAKKNSRIKRFIAAASFGVNAFLEEIDYSSERQIDRRTITGLSSCAYIEQKLNVVISGKTGSGKTYLACALGTAACRQGMSVRYYRIPELLLEIQQAKLDNKYNRYIKSLNKARLLILDDIGLKSYTLEESRDVLEITEGRYNKSSTILSGQVSHTMWYELFPDPTIADAILDRVIHNSYIIELDSKVSMREIAAKKVMKNLENDALLP
ncbi:MAG: IS21-like element helper ATPase IstB [Clostridia bacterium]